MERRESNIDPLIDQIYDAGACPDQWPTALSSIASAANALSAIMFGFSHARGLVFEHNGALDDVCSTIFKTRHGQPRLGTGHGEEAGQPDRRLGQHSKIQILEGDRLLRRCVTASAQVKTYMRRIYEKLNVRRRGESVFLLSQRALGDLQP